MVIPTEARLLRPGWSCGTARHFPAPAFLAPGHAVKGPWQYVSKTEVDETKPTNDHRRS